MANGEENKKSNNYDLIPYKADIFATYCLWKSLPTMVRFPPLTKEGNIQTSKEFMQAMGIEDESIFELADIKFQKDFAKKYDVSPETLTDWNRTQQVRESLADIRDWGRTLSKNVIFSLYNTIMKNGSASEVKLFLQVVEQWEEKTKVEHTHKGIDKFIIIRNGQQPTTATEPVGTGDSVGTDGQAS